MKTPFLRSLKPVNKDTRPAQTAQRYMEIKGFRGIKPLGYAGGGGTWYFYYRIPEGIIELEITRNAETDTFSKLVTAMITDPAEIKERIGE